MEFNLSRLKKLAGVELVAEDDDNVVDVSGDDEDQPNAPASDAKLPQPKPDAKAPPFAAKEPAKASTDTDKKAQRAEIMKRAASEMLDPHLIRASVKHLVDKAHQQVQSGNKEIGDIKSELEHYHDVLHANLRGRHQFPFANPAATTEDKQNAADIFEIANQLDRTLRTDLGVKKSNDIDWLKGVN